GGVRGASRSGSASVITTHALFARKVQRKLSNSVAGFPAGGSSSDRKRSRPIRAFSATPHDGQRPCRTLAADPGTTPPRAAYPRRCSSNASGLPGRNSARILGIRARFQRDNLRRHFGVRISHAQPGSWSPRGVERINGRPAVYCFRPDGRRNAAAKTTTILFFAGIAASAFGAPRTHVLITAAA